MDWGYYVAMTPAREFLSVRDVQKAFPSANDGQPLPILKGANFTAKRGESIAIVGPSGSGKSTLLNLIGALDTPDSGSITLDGRDLGSMSEDEQARFRNESIGFIFQSHHLIPHLTALENALTPVLAHNSKATVEHLERAKSLFSQVGLGDRSTHRPAQLSGGERQRVAFVRALINQPKLLLADEPTGALDQASTTVLADLLRELNQSESVTLIVVTHSLDLARRMETQLELRDGQLIAWEDTQ